MLTPEERRKLESEWSPEDQAFVRMARYVRGAVLTLMIAGLGWVGSSDGRLDNANEVSVTAALPAPPRVEGSAVRASRQALDERRARWEATRDRPAEKFAIGRVEQ